MGEALPPKVVREHVDAHDKRMEDGRDDWQRYKAAYLTQFWKSQTAGPVPEELPSQIQIEVNRMYGVIESYLSALYPKASRVVVAPGPTLGGDAYKSELAANKWLLQNKTHVRMVKSIRQALLYPGSAVKVGVDDGPGDPLDRVWFRVVPWWELMLDHDVYDEDDSRFIGHIYHRPIQEVEDQYGVEGLKGSPREDFLDPYGQVKGGSYRERLERWRSKDTRADSDNHAFVRVLELCNFIDSYSGNGQSMRGRMEVYLLDQGEGYDEPVFSGPMPFSTRAGDPMPHIVPLVFNTEPEYPLRGVSHAARIYPQVSEINVFRSFKANAARRDSRQYLALDGVLTSDQMSMLTAGVDGLVIPVEDTRLQGRDLRSVVVPLTSAPISSNIESYQQQAEIDLQRAAGTSPNAYGTVTKATATEIMNLRDYTESEFGRHAMIKDNWIADIVRVFFRAVIAAMEAPASGTGDGVEDQRQILDGEADEPPGWTVGKIQALSASLGLEYDTEDFRQITESVIGTSALDEASEGELERLADHLNEKYAVEVPEEEEEAEEPVEGEEEEGAEEENEEEESDEEEGLSEDGVEVVEVGPDFLRIKDGREVIEINIDDLDGDFIVEVVDARSTPFSDAALRQALVELLDPLQALWGIVQKGGPEAMLARAQMASIVEKYDLPPDMHPDNLESEIAEREEAKPKPPDNVVPMVPPGGPPGAPAGPPGAPPPPAGGAGVPQEAAQQLLSMPPDQALGILIEALQKTPGTPPEVMQMLQQALQSPPEQQRQVVQQVIGASG